MGIDVEAVISDRDLAFVRDMRSHPSDELEVVHPLYLFGIFAILVADLACVFIEGEAFQREQRPDHILSHAPSLIFSLGSDQAMDVEPRMPPGEKAFCPFRTQEFHVNKKPKNLPSEELHQARIINPGDFVEDTGLVHSSLGHQEMDVRVEIHMRVHIHNRHGGWRVDHLLVGRFGDDGGVAQGG